MIKYLGSKRTLVPVLSQIAEASGARTAVDMFTGTTRVAQGFKKLGLEVTANDIATYSQVLAQTYIATDARSVDTAQLSAIIEDLANTKPEAGYFTEVFCERARFFQPKNGARIDAIRERLATEFAAHPYYPILLTSLIEAADRVDSTTGVQMAFLKQWAPRSHADLELRLPQLLPGGGAAVRGDANQVATQLEPTDLMYLDPPYNQHRYFTNYHIWETLVRWDKPPTYGVAQKREDSRDETTKSAYNKKPQMKQTFFDLIDSVQAQTLVVSYNDEAWITVPEMQEALAGKYPAQTLLSFDYRRYVGAKIGIHNPAGEKVGTVTHLRNKEHIFIAGTPGSVSAIEAALQ